MNKRQIKKKNKIMNERFSFFNCHILSYGRQNGKTSIINSMYKSCYSKKYKYFKRLKRIYNKIFMSIDWSNGRDYSVKTTYAQDKGVIKVLSSEVID